VAELTEDVARRFLAGTPLEAVVPAPEVAFAVVAMTMACRR